MIFVTLGSQKFQFNRLLEKIDKLVLEGIIKNYVFAQTGYSDYIPQNYQYKQFLNRDEFLEIENKADIVVTHGGTGAIIGAVKQNKKVIAVPRLKEYGEHVDNHQIQLLKQFDDLGIIEVCYNVENLDKAFTNVFNTSYNRYYSNTKKIITSIENYLKTL